MICNWYLQTLASQTGGSCKQVVADAKGQGSIRRNNFTVFVYFQTVLLFENFFLNLVPNYVSGKPVFCIFVPDCSVPGCASRKFLQHFASPSLKFQGFSFTFNSDCTLKDSFRFSPKFCFWTTYFLHFRPGVFRPGLCFQNFPSAFRFPPLSNFKALVLHSTRSAILNFSSLAGITTWQHAFGIGIQCRRCPSSFLIISCLLKS